MTSKRHKRHGIMAAVVAVVLALPSATLAQTAPAAEAPSAAAPQSAAAPPAVATPATGPVTSSPDIALKLPRDLSPWGMFMAADIVVKAVMVGLAFASVLTWTIWFAKAIELLMVRRRDAAPRSTALSPGAFLERSRRHA